MDDNKIRVAAFDRLAILCRVFGDDIPWAAIADGFSVSGEKILFANKAVGIFKPRQMGRGAISIKTTRPRHGRVNVYADKEGADGDFIYSLQGDDPNNHYNRALAESMLDQTPIIYFHAVAEGVYKAIYPCFVESIDTAAMTCRVTVGQVANSDYPMRPETLMMLPDQVERRYAVREAKVRLHQATFREMVLSAYGKKCAMSSLPVPELLEAAHIIPDSHDEGVAGIRNGICLSRIHHRAFDANLIGIDPDYRIKISDRLLGISDGPVLEEGLKALNGRQIDLPRDKSLWPSAELLEKRFSAFNSWTWSE